MPGVTLRVRAVQTRRPHWTLVDYTRQAADRFPLADVCLAQAAVAACAEVAACVVAARAAVAVACVVVASLSWAVEFGTIIAVAGTPDCGVAWHAIGVRVSRGKHRNGRSVRGRGLPADGKALKPLTY